MGAQGAVMCGTFGSFRELRDFVLGSVRAKPHLNAGINEFM